MFTMWPTYNHKISHPKFIIVSKIYCYLLIFFKSESRNRVWRCLIFVLLDVPYLIEQMKPPDTSSLKCLIVAQLHGIWLRFGGVRLTYYPKDLNKHIIRGDLVILNNKIKTCFFVMSQTTTWVFWRYRNRVIFFWFKTSKKVTLARRDKSNVSFLNYTSSHRTSFRNLIGTFAF